MLPDQQSQSVDGFADTVRELGVADLPDLIELLDRDQDANSVVAERVVAAQLDPLGSGGPTWGWFSDGQLRSAVFIGPNVILAETTPQARREFAARLSQVGRRSSAIVGYREEVLDLGGASNRRGAMPRSTRDQPLMVCTHDPEPELEGVRRLGIEQIMFMPAPRSTCSPRSRSFPDCRRGPGSARVAQSIFRAGCTGGSITAKRSFKAKSGQLAGECCNCKVWITPRLRGSGLSISALSAVVRIARAEHAPRISLYANSHNEPALRAYEHVGFRQVGTFATVLF
jgi:hypothetical protein